MRLSFPKKTKKTKRKTERRKDGKTERRKEGKMEIGKNGKRKKEKMNKEKRKKKKRKKEKRRTIESKRTLAAKIVFIFEQKKKYSNKEVPFLKYLLLFQEIMPTSFPVKRLSDPKSSSLSV